jgi:hypothetical protein
VPVSAGRAMSPLRFVSLTENLMMIAMSCVDGGRCHGSPGGAFTPDAVVASSRASPPLQTSASHSLRTFCRHGMLHIRWHEHRRHWNSCGSVAIETAAGLTPARRVSLHPQQSGGE